LPIVLETKVPVWELVAINVLSLKYALLPVF